MLRTFLLLVGDSLVCPLVRHHHPLTIVKLLFIIFTFQFDPSTVAGISLVMLHVYSRHIEFVKYRDYVLSRFKIIASNGIHPCNIERRYIHD